MVAMPLDRASHSRLLVSSENRTGARRDSRFPGVARSRENGSSRWGIRRGNHTDLVTRFIIFRRHDGAMVAARD